MYYKKYLVFVFVFCISGIAMGNDDLINTLTKIDNSVPEKIKISFNSGASDPDLYKLRLLFDQIPQEVIILFKWHDGQKWNSELSKNNNRRLLSISEVNETVEFFADPLNDYMEPWQNSWLPILTNDSGDYVVIETVGKDRGKLITYWHDSKDRKIVYLSLYKWAEELLDEYQK